MHSIFNRLLVNEHKQHNITHNITVVTTYYGVYNNSDDKQAIIQYSTFEPKDLRGYPEGCLRSEVDRVQPETAVPPALWKEIAEDDCT